MNQLTYHLIVFLALLASGLVIILTGHDHSPLLGQLLGGALGGSGSAGLGSLLLNFFGTGGGPSAPAVITKQAGRASISFLIMLSMIVASVCLITVAGCASLGIQTSSQKIAVSCATASATVKSLTVVQQAGLVSHADDQGIEAALSVINPICEAPTQPTYSSVEVSAVNTALQELVTYQSKYHATPTGQ